MRAVRVRVCDNEERCILCSYPHTHTHSISLFNSKTTPPPPPPASSLLLTRRTMSWSYSRRSLSASSSRCRSLWGVGTHTQRTEHRPHAHAPKHNTTQQHTAHSTQYKAKRPSAAERRASAFVGKSCAGWVLRRHEAQEHEKNMIGKGDWG